jgi:hypothetical protein
MSCAFCARMCEWPFDFPDTTYSVCRVCYPAWSGQRIESARPWMGALYGIGRWLRSWLTKGSTR